MTGATGGEDEAGAAVTEAGDVGDQISRGRRMNTGKKNILSSQILNNNNTVRSSQYQAYIQIIIEYFM